MPVVPFWFLPLLRSLSFRCCRCNASPVAGWRIARFLLLCTVSGALQAAPLPTVAFYYGDAPPLSDLQAFDIAVVEPDHVPNPKLYARAPKDGAHELFAYVSLGEVLSSRSYYAKLPAGVLRGDNPAWGSKVIDQTAPGWREFFLTQIIAPLWRQGWRGFFIDTLDSYQLFAKTDAERTAQTQALIGTLQEFKRRYPDARLMLNRGFELLPTVAPITYAVAAESLYRGYDAGSKTYRPVPEADRAWLLGQLKTVRDEYHLPVIAIDYVDPNQPQARAQARETANKIRQHGFIPWVADGELNSIGIGAIELIPRTVLVVVESQPGSNLDETAAQRFLGMPLNYLGLRYEIVDLRTDALPQGIFSGRYAGIVTWFHSGSVHPEVLPWLKQHMTQGVRVVVLDSFGYALDAKAASGFGMQMFNARRPDKLTIDSQDKALIGFEVQPLPERDLIQRLRVADGAGHSLLRLKDNRGNTYDGAAIMPWGGFALAPFVLQTIDSADQDRWILQPLEFLRAALALPVVPVPDVTTEGGRRMLMSHIDGDGFASRAEFPGSPFTGEVVRKEILERYRIPITVSVIEGEISPEGLYPKEAPALESLARQIFALPYVEGASHSLSHPFFWIDIMEKNLAPAAVNEKGEPYNLDIPNYRFNLAREVRGSMDYINRKLMPKGKKAAIFLWTGDCTPPAAAVAETYRDGYLNMNGGDTLITNTNHTWAAIAAQGVRKDGWYQVYAPNQNENVYTNEWLGPFYGFQRVVETYQLTETPYRFKPVDIYYHFYSASKPASLEALHKAYRWALARPMTHVYASQYIHKVLDFESMTLARDLDSGDLLVRSGADLRTLRLPAGARTPSLQASTNLAGISPGPSAQYLTLTAAQARLIWKTEEKPPVSLHDANGSISDMSRHQQGSTADFGFVLNANGDAEFTLAQAVDCRVSVDGRAVAAQTGSDQSLRRFKVRAQPVQGMTLTARYAVLAHCGA